jgi:hypothetical protein
MQTSAEPRAIKAVDGAAAVRLAVAETTAALRRAAVLIELLDRIAAAESVEQARGAFVTGLRRAVGCDDVLLGLRSAGGGCRVRAWADAAVESLSPSRRDAAEAAMDECLLRGDCGRDVSTWPAQPDRRHGLLAHRRAAEVFGSAAVVTLPLTDPRGEVVAVCLVLGDSAWHERPEPRRFLDAAQGSLSTALAASERMNRGRFFDRLTNWMRWPRSRRGRVALIAVVAFAALLCVPWTYRLDCRCEAQPVVRRVVAAPFDGKLLKAHVEPGDVVRAGQTLAVLDGREVRWELAGVVAEHSRAGKERDRHFSEHDFGAARLAELEQERLAHRRRLLEDRTTNLVVRSPSDGVVIAGDVKRFEGKPLEIGETLFEVAPLDRMLVEVEVPEDQVRHVAAGQPVAIALEAFPGRRWTGRVARIHPRAETRDDRHVFIAEVELPNADALLRPGMRGEARLTGPRRTLGWCLFHRPLAKLLFWLGW